jgi:hypothetical protein
LQKERDDLLTKNKKLRKKIDQGDRLIKEAGEKYAELDQDKKNLEQKIQTV